MRGIKNVDKLDLSTFFVYLCILQLILNFDITMSKDTVKNLDALRDAMRKVNVSAVIIIPRILKLKAIYLKYITITNPLPALKTRL